MSWKGSVSCRDPAMVATPSKAVKKLSTWTEAPHKHVGVQVAGCGGCWSLALCDCLRKHLLCINGSEGKT